MKNIKKLLCPLLCGALLCCAPAVPGSLDVCAAETITDSSGLWEYELLDDGTAMLSRGENILDEAVAIPESVDGISVTAIGYNILLNGKNTKSITIPASVISIEDGAFVNCTALQKFEVAPDSASYTAQNGILFSKDMTELVAYPAGVYPTKEYSVPDTVKRISGFAFFQNSYIDTITLPSGVLEIGEQAFTHALPDEIIIPDTVTEIGDGAFGDIQTSTGKSVKITIDPANTSFTVINDILMSADGKRILSYGYSKSSKTYAVPSGVERIDTRAFNKNSALSEVYMPGSVNTVGNYVFSGCVNLEKLELSPNLGNIPTGFANACPSLKEVVIKEGTSEIGRAAFTNVQKITIPESVTYIQNSAFDERTDLEIWGYVGSYAEKFANENQIKFVDIENPPSPTPVPSDTPAPKPTPEKPAFEYRIGGPSVTNTSGEILDSPPIGESFLVNVRVDKLTDGNEPVYVFVAVYDENGALLSIDYVRANFAKGSDYEFGFHIPAQTAKVGEIRSFAWSDFDSAKPLAETKKIIFD